MVSVSRLAASILLAEPTTYQDIILPGQASVEQYSILRYMGGSGPYVQHPGYGIPNQIPEECQIQQVQVFARHGERYPSASKGEDFEGLLKKFKSYSEPFKGPLYFLNEYEYFVKRKKDYEMLTTPSNSRSQYNGYADAIRHGIFFRQKYGSLYDENFVLPLFTTNNMRVYETSQGFIEGFLSDEHSTEKFKNIILSEDSQMGANSLTPASACSTWSDDYANEIVSRYSSKYLESIKKRLLKDNKGLNLSTDDVYTLFDWCAYEMNVKGISQFCSLFSQDELVKYEYSQDLYGFYSDGTGNKVIKPIGSVLFNASRQLLNEDTENKIWLSFFHDTDLENYLAAIGLFDTGKNLTLKYIDFDRKYTKSTLVPMGARLYVEKLNCSGKNYVRYILNDAVIPIPGCSNGPGFSCELNDFNNYFFKRLEGVDYKEQCNIGNASDHLTFYWDYMTKDYSAPLKKLSY
ncbi:uncharacterized protein PRCAT00002529001 [Priceomyces carsonii]|uniref:uncharacterized protein n=1 Tax=Priceomyces carsonii TaxID=28549 RepID=UPI002ED9FAFD|nr:unnamed protein product [Priceomyces carsonii]